MSEAAGAVWVEMAGPSGPAAKVWVGGAIQGIPKYIRADLHDTRIAELEAERDGLITLATAQAAQIEGLTKERDRRTEMHECAMSERDDATLYADEQKARADALAARVRELEAALTPSGETKAEYSGEFSISVYDGLDEDDAEKWRQVLVDWTTIKAIMAAIKARAALTQKEPKP